MKIRPLALEETELVDAHLPLHRLDRHVRGGSVYLVAWDGGVPIAHAHLDWDGPELQDVWVAPAHRRRGVATALTAEAERLARERGCVELTLSYGVENLAARTLYERAGYVHAGRPPERVKGTITLRGAPFEVDDTLVDLVKRLG